MLAPYAHRTGPGQTQRLVEEAIGRFMPEFAKERRDRAADGRHVDIDADQVSFAGTARVHGELDLADALDLEDAIRTGADELKTLGSTDPLDVRRAAALGVLARGQHPLDLTAGAGESGHADRVGGSRLAEARTNRRTTARPMAGRWCCSCTCPPTRSVAVTRTRWPGWRTPVGSCSPPGRSPSGASARAPPRWS